MNIIVNVKWANNRYISLVNVWFDSELEQFANDRLIDDALQKWIEVIIE